MVYANYRLVVKCFKPFNYKGGYSFKVLTIERFNHRMF